MKTATVPNIPGNILNEFLESKLGYKELNSVINTRCHFLWSRNNVDRYRINVWIKEHLDVWDLDIQKIGYSFFVHYDNDSQTVEDKTVAS
jgi:hypothetical protein